MDSPAGGAVDQNMDSPAGGAVYQNMDSPAGGAGVGSKSIDTFLKIDRFENEENLSQRLYI